MYKDNNNTRHLYWYVYFSTYHTSVGYCLFVHGYSRTFDQIDKQLHTFFFNKITIKELDGN